VHGVYDTLGVSADGFAALDSALQSMNEERREAVISDVDEYYELALADMESEEVPDEWFPFSSEYHADVIRSDEKVVSILQTFYSFAGGAHPNTYYGTENLDTATGRKLGIKDIVSDTEEFARILEEETLKAVDKDMLIVEDVSGVIKELMDETVSENELEFIIDYEGLEVIFSPYELTAYAAGAQKVRLNYADYPELIDQSYAAAPESYIDKVFEGVSYYTGRPGDSDRREIDFEETADQYGTISACKVLLEGRAGEPDTEGYYYGSVKYIAHMGDKTYALVSKVTDNDYWFTTIYDLNSEAAVKKENLDAQPDRHSLPVDPAALKLVKRCNCLSTYDVVQLHRMNEDGSVQPVEEFGYVEKNDYLSPLRLKTTVDVKMLDDVEGKTMHDVTLGSQTEVEFYRTDMDRLVDMKLKDGNIVRFEIEHGGEGIYSQMIGGQPIEEVFEEVYFAG
ncbi:MAG: DUF3298 and DUF4163 domain-containing protein, partial [Lachnospiraceae bacterium]|nr:DUF3298 and DUF4163 domain-containing protein [Lachnospiraceae bacterium]